MIVLHTPETIKALLDKSDLAVVRAMFALQNRQTADEAAGHMTRHTNGVGWSKFDAPWMAEMIQSYNRWKRLTPAQLAVTRNKVKRYARQLSEIANERSASMPAASPATMPEASEVDAELVQRIADKNEIARLETLAEAQGFMSDPDYQDADYGRF